MGMNIENERFLERRIFLEDKDLNQVIEVVAGVGERLNIRVVLKGGAVREAVWNLYHGTRFLPRDIDFFVDSKIHLFHRELIKKGMQTVERYTRRGTPVFKYKASFAPQLDIEIGYLITETRDYHKGRRWPEILTADAYYTDLRVNSLSLNIQPGKHAWSLEEINDPLGGIEDIARKELQLTVPHALSRSPHSIFRIVRIASQLQAQIAQGTLEQMRKDVLCIRRIPTALLWEEANKIIQLENDGKAISMLEEIGAIDVLFPGRTAPAQEIFEKWFTGEEFTVVMLKPDGVEKQLTKEIITGLNEQGLVLAVSLRKILSDQEILQIYPDIKNSWLIPRVIKHLTSGPCEILLFLGEGAIFKARRFIGTTALGGREPSGIRGKYAEDFIKNVAHAPEDIKELKTAVRIMLPSLPVRFNLEQ